jgi:hypothetical protein
MDARPATEWKINTYNKGKLTVTINITTYSSVTITASQVGIRYA